MKKEVLILAKSYKRNKYSIAGIDVDRGTWVRVVSQDVMSENAISKDEIKYDSGEDAEVLDIAEISFERDVATKVQPENCLIASDVIWKKCGVADSQEVIDKYVDNSKKFVFYSKGNSINDVIFEHVDVTYSLALIEAENFTVRILGDSNRVKIKANFTYNGILYSSMSITDVGFTEKYKEEYEETGQTTFELGTRYIVTSLTGKNTDGNYYKLIATVL